MGKLWEPGNRYTPPRFSGRQKSLYGDKRKRNWPWKKILRQSIASIIIFFLIWGIFQFESPLLLPVQARIRQWFTEDYSITPVLKFFYDVGLWGDTFERAAFEATVSEEEPRPLTVPVSGQITKPFGWVISTGQAQSFHDGIVIAAPEGTPVKAAQAGTVIRVANEERMGRMVEIKSEDGFIFTYGHCKEILVNLNDKILMGQVIAKVGQTGSAINPQLYFRITKDGEPLDPAALFIPSAENI